MRGAKIVEKMKMQSLDKVAENIRNVEALFPNAVTEQKFGGGGTKNY